MAGKIIAISPKSSWYMDINKLINNLFEIDQAIRQNPEFPMELIEKTDNYCTEVLKELVRLNGIITIDKSDELTAKRFVILVQHSRDLEFAQDICNRLQKEDINNIPKTILPLLIDKLLAKAGKEQRFGTIVSTKYDDKNESSAEPKPIEDIDNVDKRRLEYGLGPLNKYLEIVIRDFKKFSRENNIDE